MALARGRALPPRAASGAHKATVDRLDDPTGRNRPAITVAPR